MHLLVSELRRGTVVCMSVSVRIAGTLNYTAMRSNLMRAIGQEFHPTSEA